MTDNTSDVDILSDMLTLTPLHASCDLPAVPCHSEEILRLLVHGQLGCADMLRCCTTSDIRLPSLLFIKGLWSMIPCHAGVA